MAAGCPASVAADEPADEREEFGEPESARNAIVHVAVPPGLPA
jgi:hypothetical protein